MAAFFSRMVERIRTGFWFLPMVMLVASAALALVLLHLDRIADPGLHSTLAWAYSGGPEGARSLLSTIAGSMITAASVTFSLASVALSIASQQYGSRVLRNFMRDRITQVLLGTFVATFIYSVLVVRSIRGSDVSGGFVPAIAVTTAIVLSLMSLVLLIYFIHHVSTSIQASHIVRVITQDLEDAIPRLYPTHGGTPEPAKDGGVPETSPTFQLIAERSGYLQTVDLNRVLEVAAKHQLLVRLCVKPGDHLLMGLPLADLWGTAEVDAQERKAMLNAFYIDRERTAAQDIRYQFQQLTDVIVRALSAGINDPFTAVNGIDALTSSLLLFTQRSEVQEQRRDKAGVLRLVAPHADLSEVLESTVGHIAVYSATDPFVMRALRRTLTVITPHLQQDSERATVEALHAELDRREAAES